MDPAISQAIATFIGAMTTALLLFASYMWGPNSRRQRKKKKDDTPEDDDS